MSALRKTWRTVKVSLVRETAPAPYDATVRTPEACAALFRHFIADDPRECFCALYLDSRHKPVAIHRVSIGTATEASVHPREVFGPAIQLGATAIVVAHNHPSGDPTPSSMDRTITERLREAGQLLGVEVLDHVIVTPESHYSFAEGAGL